MKSTLETVWDWYLAEHATERSEAEKELHRALIRDAEALRGLLNKEQTDALQKYEDRQNEIASLLESEAFAKGARFATAYMVEALRDK